MPTAAAARLKASVRHVVLTRSGIGFAAQTQSPSALAAREQSGGAAEGAMERAEGAPSPPQPSAPAPPLASSPLRPFLLERFFAKWEFAAPHLLCCSDAEPLALAELLTAADAGAAAAWARLSLGYTTTEGAPELRAAIAARYETLGAADVLVAAPQEAIFLAVTALVKPGDRVIVTWPGYGSLLEIARAAGARVSKWEPERGAPAGAAPCFAVADLRALATPDTSLIILNFPHNPSGALLSRAEFAEVVALAENCGAVLFSDEMYRGLERDPLARLPAAADVYARGVSLCGLSKAVGAPGLRVGWLATRDAALLQRCAELKDYTTICAAAPSEALALIAVRSWDALAARAARVIAANLDELAAFARRWPHVLEWQPPPAGTVAFPRLNARLLGAPDVGSACEALAAEDGVLLLPATVYEHAPSAAAGRARVGFGRAGLPAALAALEAALRRRGLRPWTAGDPPPEPW
jgi:aspartate/methionine/tyrosine aminotransferase